jgi:hypothetical protein
MGKKQNSSKMRASASERGDVDFRTMLRDINGQPLTVEDFIADAELVQQGLPPKHVKIGMKYT